MEKVWFFVFGTLVAALGYFIKKNLDGIEGTQKEQGKTLYNISERLTRVEGKQDSTNAAMGKVQQQMEHIQSTSREAKSTLDHNLYELRQNMKKVEDKHYEHEKNFGKIILIVQKLFARSQNGS